jgi:hypothetical protein
MLNLKIRKLAVTVVMIASSATALAGLAAAGTSATAIAATTTATTVSGAQSASPTFHLINSNGNYHLCLGISGGNDDSPAVQWSCNNNPDQIWHWGAANSAGYRELVNNDNQCLGVAGESKEWGARVYGWTCNGHPDQYWQPVPNNGYDGLNDYHSQLVLGVAGNSTAVGAAIVQWPFNDLGNQWWILG